MTQSEKTGDGRQETGGGAGTKAGNSPFAMPSSQLALEVRDLHYTYEDGTAALQGVTFSAAAGECVGLIGPNGSGKSTLLLHLNGILPERLREAGAVRVFGREVSRATVDAVRRDVGLLFQNPDDQLFCPTVFEDVAFGPRQFGLAEADLAARVANALREVGMLGFEKRHPQHLSVGERRRVCLAGVLACEPRVLVLDEPTSGLDPRGRRELKALLGAIPITKILATHDLEFVVESCRRTLVLDGGRVVAEGETVKLLSDEELMLRHGLERPHALQHLHPHHR